MYLYKGWLALSELVLAMGMGLVLGRNYSLTDLKN